MSNFHTQTNQGRADKMIEIIGHLSKSAKSNKADPVEMAELLQPVLDAMLEMGAALSIEVDELDGPPITVTKVDNSVLDHDMTKAVPSRGPVYEDADPFIPGGSDMNRVCAAERNAPQWATFHDMALAIPFSCVGPALAVLSQRMDDALYEIKNGG